MSTLNLETLAETLRAASDHASNNGENGEKSLREKEGLERDCAIADIACCYTTAAVLAALAVAIRAATEEEDDAE